MYSEYGVTLTESQRLSLARALSSKSGITLRLAVGQLSGPHKLMLTKTQINKIARAKASGKGVDIKLSKTQIGKQGGFGPLVGSLLAGIAAPMIGKMFGLGQQGDGMVLPGSRGRGLQLPGTRRGRGKKKRRITMDVTSTFQKMKPLSNFDIEKICKKLKINNFRGVFSKDMLPLIMKGYESVVINIQDYLDGGGTHWVCVYNSPHNKDVLYFDSFGMKPSDVVIKYMKTAGKGVVYNSGHIQNMNSIMCGYWCIYVINELYNGRSFIDILMDFDFNGSKENEKVIRKFARKII